MQWDRDTAKMVVLNLHFWQRVTIKEPHGFFPISTFQVYTGLITNWGLTQWIFHDWFMLITEWSDVGLGSCARRRWCPLHKDLRVLEGRGFFLPHRHLAILCSHLFCPKGKAIQIRGCKGVPSSANMLCSRHSLNYSASMMCLVRLYITNSSSFSRHQNHSNSTVFVPNSKGLPLLRQTPKFNGDSCFPFSVS